MLKGFITPGLIPAAFNASRPWIASPLPGKCASWASFGFSRRPMLTSTPTITSPTIATGSGRRSTNRAQRPQPPYSGWSGLTRRFGITRTLLMRAPRTDSIAGRRVIAVVTETAGISIPPMPIDRMNGRGRTISDSRPTATVEPDTITDRPAWVIVSTMADSTSAPSRSSSRKRKIISNA